LVAPPIVTYYFPNNFAALIHKRFPLPTQKLLFNMTVRETCLVEAPSDLPEGYLFDVTVDGITVGSQKCRLRAWCCFLFILAPLSIRGDSDETVLERRFYIGTILIILVVSFHFIKSANNSCSFP